MNGGRIGMKRPPCHSLGRFASTCILHRLAERRKACPKIEKTTSRAGAALAILVHREDLEEQAKAPKTKGVMQSWIEGGHVTFR